MAPIIDEQEFRIHSEAAIEALKQRLIRLEEDGTFEVEEQSGVLQLLFEDPPGKFVLTPNSPVRQIWISALSTSFKLDWDPSAAAFIFPRTGEILSALIDRLIREHLAS